MKTDDNQANKALVWAFWQQLENTDPAEAAAVAGRYLHDHHHWRGFDPVTEARGPEAWAENFWVPFTRAFTGLERKTHMFLGGRSNGHEDGKNDGKQVVGGTGYFEGRFEQDWLGLSASGQSVQIRWGEICQVDEGKIVTSWMLLDLVDLFRQLDIAVLPPTRGRADLYPPPAGGAAILLDRQAPEASAKTLDLIRRFIFEGLNVYDETELESMNVASYFHPDVQWYGPGGIGACAGLDEFEQLHQRHWLHAFPDRTVQPLDCLYAEGDFTGAAGWDGVVATHSGEYLGEPASGRRISVTGLDFWRRDGEQFVENWIFVDMLHLFRQFGVDLLQRAISR